MAWQSRRQAGGVFGSTRASELGAPPREDSTAGTPDGLELLGRTITLKVSRLDAHGAMVDAGVHGELFVPQSQLPHELAAGDHLRVFLYVSGGRVLATARRPYLQCGNVGLLKVNSVDYGTAYLESGLPKEIVLPRGEQRTEPWPGDMVLVQVRLDVKGRLYATERLEDHIAEASAPGEYRSGDEVRLVPVKRTDLGIKVVVDDHVFAVIYENELPPGLKWGSRADGFVLRVRPDLRLDAGFGRPGAAGLEDAADVLCACLRRHGGRLALGDDSPPELIRQMTGLSKKRFKQACGRLYRQGLVELGADSLKLLKP